VNSGATYTVWIQVRSRYGTGKWAETTAAIQPSLGQVTKLMAHADSHNPTLAHLTWGPPSKVKSSILVSNIDC